MPSSGANVVVQFMVASPEPRVSWLRMFVPMGLAALAPQNLGFLRRLAAFLAGYMDMPIGFPTVHPCVSVNSFAGVFGIAMLALLVFAVVPSLVDWSSWAALELKMGEGMPV